ncbi:MAG TPA: hypothetical protein VFQ23_11865, partial [Anaerolineales bacterium]|nr:hypothetical protein [Anaerolineales bacterium]
VFQMGKGYRDDTGGQELYQLSVEAYEKCLSLKPNDAQWHAGFADLLAERAMWDSWFGDPTPEAFRALEEIHTALELAPNDPIVREIAQNITYLIPDAITQNGDSFDFPWLTATPTALPPTPTMPPPEESTPTPPTSPAATETSPAQPTPVGPTQTNPAPVPEASNPLCGSAGLLPLIAIIWFVWKRR